MPVARLCGWLCVRGCLCVFCLSVCAVRRPVEKPSEPLPLPLPRPCPPFLRPLLLTLWSVSDRGPESVPDRIMSERRFASFLLLATRGPVVPPRPAGWEPNLATSQPCTHTHTHTHTHTPQVRCAARVPRGAWGARAGGDSRGERQHHWGWGQRGRRGTGVRDRGTEDRGQGTAHAVASPLQRVA